jgi:predicted transcriptional regulator
MEKTNTEEKLYHQHLFRLDDNLNAKLMNHMDEFDMTMSGIIRRSLRMFFEKEAIKHDGQERTKKTMSMK